MPGWGEWSGPGVKQQKQKPKVVQAPGGIEASKRKDFRARWMSLSMKKGRKRYWLAILVNQAAKYMQTRVPHGFQTQRPIRERTIANPLGKEWNPQTSFSKMTKPRIITKLGAVIAPLKKQ